MQQIVGVLDPLGDPLVGEEFAEIVVAEIGLQLLDGDIRIDRHPAPGRLYSAAVPAALSSSLRWRGKGKNMLSSTAETVSTLIS